MKSFCSLRAKSIRLQLTGKLASVTSEQQAGERVKADSIDVSSMGVMNNGGGMPGGDNNQGFPGGMPGGDNNQGSPGGMPGNMGTPPAGSPGGNMGTPPAGSPGGNMGTPPAGAPPQGGGQGS